MNYWFLTFIRPRASRCFLAFLSLLLTVFMYIATQSQFSQIITNFDLSMSGLPLSEVDFTNGTVQIFASNSTHKNCTVLHIASVCAGTNSTRSLFQMLNSVLYYRSNPLHLHVLTDVATKEYLKSSFRKWTLPQFNVTFYDNEKWISKVAWIPNQHYSGVYGLLKLMLPEALQSIDKVLVLDTDITFLADISNLWHNFDKFNDHQMLGLVENQSGLYTKLWVTGVRPWPAIGNGFNTGVILMDLKRIRDRNFFGMWMATCEKHLKEYHQVRTADQDIINATIKDNALIAFTLDCTWNVQLSDHTTSDQCYGEGRTIQILHWNSRHKQRVKNKHAKHFILAYRFFLEMDRNLLRRRIFGCENVINSQSKTVGKRKRDEQNDKIGSQSSSSGRSMRPRPNKRNCRVSFADLSEESDEECVVQQHGYSSNICGHEHAILRKNNSFKNFIPEI